MKDSEILKAVLGFTICTGYGVILGHLPVPVSAGCYAVGVAVLVLVSKRMKKK